MSRPLARRLALAPLAAMLAVALGSTAFAHPGHGTGFTAGLAHPFGGLDHLLAMVAAGLWAAQVGGRAAWLLPAAFMAALGAGTIIGASGVGLPWVEAGIIGSVIALGAAVACRLQPSLAAGAAVVGAFGLLHGHAHGAELPPDGAALAYAAGFLLASLTLLSGGLAIGWSARTAPALRAAGGAIAVAGLAMVVLP